MSGSYSDSNKRPRYKERRDNGNFSYLGEGGWVEKCFRWRKGLLESEVSVCLYKCLNSDDLCEPSYANKTSLSVAFFKPLFSSLSPGVKAESFR